mmetsp:Transcript_26594/g.60664  ORF Transcript_26594/g.60664 Transcript_26594/m.60664 type:complete len:264 (+) Transcript_26594:500-1291(+)
MSPMQRRRESWAESQHETEGVRSELSCRIRGGQAQNETSCFEEHSNRCTVKFREGRGGEQEQESSWKAPAQSGYIPFFPQDASGGRERGKELGSSPPRSPSSTSPPRSSPPTALSGRRDGKLLPARTPLAQGSPRRPAAPPSELKSLTSAAGCRGETAARAGGRRCSEGREWQPWRGNFPATSCSRHHIQARSTLLSLLLLLDHPRIACSLRSERAMASACGRRRCWSSWRRAVWLPDVGDREEEDEDRELRSRRASSSPCRR